eukprot:m.38097 g.38097  ORF g.38097 m.38097 type:complete len:124 (+) comp12577_c0_seq4:225-596(+)
MMPTVRREWLESAAGSVGSWQGEQELEQANTNVVDTFFSSIDRRLYGEVDYPPSSSPPSPPLPSSPLEEEALPYFARKQIKPEADGLMPDIAQECEAWRATFPHFRVTGNQVRSQLVCWWQDE